MRTLLTLAAVAAIALLVGCANTEYKPFEAKNNMFEGRGGTKVVVDGMEIWDNGDPPRKFKILGIIDDERHGGLIPMSQLRRDMVKKAREAGGDAVVQLNSQSQIAGYYTSGSASAYASGNSATAYGSSTTMPVRRNVAKFAVIKYLD
ncbi:MAG TPA: hypothetical protein VN929_08995 [Burkholderiales bacterium]|nr:hypothetical protein [Burkholderiales bacterium]